MARDFQGAADLMKKKTFLRSGEGVIASYDWVDVASGSGQAELTALRFNGGNILSKRAFKVNTGYLGGLSGAGGNAINLGNFELEIKRPFIINGDLLIFFKEQWNKADGFKNHTMTIRIYKNDELLVSKAGSDSGTYSTGTTNQSLLISIPRTKMTIGDTLKINFLADFGTNTVPVTAIAVSCDPEEGDWVVASGSTREFTMAALELPVSLPIEVEI